MAFRSGTDDEAPPGKIMRMLDEVLELVTDFEGTKEEAQIWYNESKSKTCLKQGKAMRPIVS